MITNYILDAPKHKFLMRIACFQFSVEKENPEQLAQKIIELYENKESAKELGKRARKFVEENFDIKKSAEQYTKIYKSL